jgi:hypothetical protein
MKKYENVKTLKQALKIIAEQDRMIGELTRANNYLEDTERRRQDWLRKAKKEAGYSDRASFDTVWNDTLQKSKNPFQL